MRLASNLLLQQNIRNGKVLCNYDNQINYNGNTISFKKFCWQCKIGRSSENYRNSTFRPIFETFCLSGGTQRRTLFKEINIIDCYVLL